MSRCLLALVAGLLIVLAAPASQALTVEEMSDVVQRLDPEAEGGDSHWSFKIEEVRLTLVYDEDRDRMRVVAVIAPVNELTPEQIVRCLQANFDSALDARYALANGALWSAFIHPLGSLDRGELISGIGQTVNLVTSFGTTYSSGALVYGGGDSQRLQRELIDKLLERGQPI